ncbi:MAG: T9SS type A sorting domain-containing protein [Flavobacteriales bacterium]
MSQSYSSFLSIKQLIFISSIFSSIYSTSQIADGSLAPDFTLTDWDGVTHNLYSYLDSEKTVFVEIFAAHCPGCWGYHQTERLKNMYNLYGPEGTDEIMVLALEHDEYNDSTAFLGIGDPWVTQGNWFEGTPYPQFNVEWPDRDVFEDYNVTFYPVIYKICPDRTVERIMTSAPESELYEKVQECQIVSVSEKELEWEIYFNESSQQVIVNHSEPLHSVSIYNLQGQTVKMLESFSDTAIYVSDLTKGVYLFEFKTISGSTLAKINVY